MVAALKHICIKLLLVIVILSASFSLANPARAVCTGCLEAEFADLEKWLEEDVYKEFLLPVWMRMAEQFTAMAMHQMLIVGTFFDAKHQLETQRLFQELTAYAHKDYHPSINMCVFGTNVRVLAAAERKGELATHVLNRASLGRQLGTIDSNASEGLKEDFEGRLDLFRERYCDVNDHDGNFDILCEQSGGVGKSAPVAGRNKDIDFARTVGQALTLDLDFVDNVKSDDEIDVMALAKNLYSHRVFTRFPEVFLKDKAKQPYYLDIRAVIAKRSVAANSFHAIAGMKAKSNFTIGVNPDYTLEYMGKIMEQLGLTDNKEIAEILKDNPSYYAQMEIITKKIYQDPEFFTNLYDKPANVDRQYASMQAVGLMQDFDVLQSYLRTEAMLSVLVEMEIDKYQEEVQGRLDTMKPEGKMK